MSLRRHPLYGDNTCVVRCKLGIKSELVRLSIGVPEYISLLDKLTNKIV